MSEFTNRNAPLEMPEAEKTSAEAVAASGATSPESGVVPNLNRRMRWQVYLREKAKPKYRNPLVAAALQIFPGAGYIYMWRWGQALLTLLLFALAYVVLGLRLLEYRPEELAQRATPIAPNPEFDITNPGLATTGSLLIFLGVLLLLWLNLAGRTARQVRFENMSLTVTSKEELRKAQGTLLDRVLFFNFLVALVILFGIGQLLKDTEFDIGRLISKAGNIWNYISGMLNPDWSALFTPKGIMFRMRETLEISIVGTLLGALIAVPVSLLAARNLMGRLAITRGIYYVMRVVLSVLRSIPTLFLAIIFVVSVGVGAFPAVMALIIFSAGLMTKLFSEAIEAIDWGQVEAVQSSGGSPVHLVWFGVIPQVVPYFISHMLYSWEVNVHSASVLGLVGAGGIGDYVRDAIESYKYAQLGMALLVVIVVTVAIDFGSAFIRSRIV
jgi:phosphonate transport system permease protein